MASAAWIPFAGHYVLARPKLGRDLLARVLYGSRISLLVGIIGTLISLIIGVSFGAVAGYCGGRVDEIMMRIVDVLYSLPDILFIVILMTLFERSFLLLMVALGATSWLTMARIARGQVLSLKNELFVEAARSIGVFPNWDHSPPHRTERARPDCRLCNPDSPLSDSGGGLPELSRSRRTSAGIIARGIGGRRSTGDCGPPDLTRGTRDAHGRDAILP